MTAISKEGRQTDRGMALVNSLDFCPHLNHANISSTGNVIGNRATEKSIVIQQKPIMLAR
jgi:hypothetical protein